MSIDTKDIAADHDLSEELQDILIAISVVAKRLAVKIEEDKKTEGENDDKRRINEKI